MNIENDFLTDFDLFGKVPELYYKGKSKKSSTFGLILTALYIILYIAFLIYKLVRMFRRVDMTFYDSYSFKGLPSINLTNNEFYGGFGMGGIVDERMYYLAVTYVSKWKVNGDWVTKTVPLQTEICKLEWFGPDYRDLFADKPLDNYYCIKDVSGMVLEGYSNLERFSYFNVKFFPCVGKTADGRECYDYNTKAQFFELNTIELKIQSNDLNPEDYDIPVMRREVDMNSPVFRDIFQLMFSYLQIVNIETDEDITGLNFFGDHIRKQQYTRYDSTFIITAPLLYGDILRTGGPIADVTLQLAAKVLTEKRQYTQLIDVLGDVGGLMEIIYTVLNIISSFVTEILYDRSLVNNLFSFDLKKKYVVFNDEKHRRRSTINEKNIKGLPREPKEDYSNEYKEKFQDLNSGKDIEIYSKENSGDQDIIAKKTISSNKKTTSRRRNQSNKINPENSKTSHIKFKEQNISKGNSQNGENKLSADDDKNVVSIYNDANEFLEIENETHFSELRELKNVYINNFLVCCFWCTTKKSNVNKILFEEGSKLLTQKLDILNMFQRLYAVEIMQKKYGIEAKGKDMSTNCKKALHVYNVNNIKNNNHKTSESS